MIFHGMFTPDVFMSIFKTTTRASMDCIQKNLFLSVMKVRVRSRRHRGVRGGNSYLFLI